MESTEHKEHDESQATTTGTAASQEQNVQWRKEEKEEEQVIQRAPKSGLPGYHLKRRRFLQGMGYGSLALAGGGLLAWENQQAAHAATHTSDATQSPLVWHTSDAIKPGDLLSLHGEWLDAASAQVLLAATTDEQGNTPSAYAQKARIVQTDEQGHFLVVQVPQFLEPGQFRVWVRTATGTSASFPVNQPRPLFLSEYEAWAGQQIEIVGRNFDPREFAAHGRPRVRLIDSQGKQREAQILAFNPFAITISVPRVATTTYRLEVSTDGNQWWPLPAEETLTIVPAGKDPLELGVAWADHFKWNQIFDVSKHGVPADGKTDVTIQVQTVVNTAKTTGGGIVYFPAGTYQLSGLALPADIVLQGAGADKTTLLSTAVGGNFINTSGDGQTHGHHGVANLRIELKDPNVRPDTFLWLGEPWAQNNNTKDLTTRTASEVFVKGVDLNYSLLPPPVTSGQRGIGLEWIVKARALCTDNHFVGYRAMPFINYITNYYTVKRNFFEYSSGNVVCNGSHCFYEDNQISGHREYTAASDDLHGLFARDRTYMANNTVKGVGTFPQNDGEALCVETPNAAFNYGSVTAASATTLTVNPYSTLTNPLVYFGYLAVTIIDGRGLGQLRRVTNLDPATNQLTIDRPWDVTPDTTSAFALLLPLEQVTFYHNSITDCTKGMWFYGNTFDSVQAENTSTDSEGIYMHTVRAHGTFIPGYFARIIRNRVVGISIKSQHGGINYNTGRFDRNGAYFGTMAYGFEVSENVVSGDPQAAPLWGKTESTPFTGLGASGAFYSSQYDGNPVGGDGKNTLFANNQLTELTTGVNLTHSLYGTIVANNTYTSTVSKFLDDTGSINTLLVGNKEVNSI